MKENEPPLPGGIEAWMSLYYHWMYLERGFDISSSSPRAPGRGLTRGLSWSPWSNPTPDARQRSSSAFNRHRDRNVRLLKIFGAFNLFVVSLGIFPAGLAMIGLLIFFYNPTTF